MTQPGDAATGDPLVRSLAATGRVIGWGLLGAVCGLILGIGSGILLAPSVNPEEPLEHEWYFPHLLIAILPAEFLSGFFACALVATVAATPAARVKAFARSLIGAAVGLGLWAAFVHIRDGAGEPRHGSELWTCIFYQAFGAAVVMGLGAWRDEARERHHEPDRQGENDA